MGNGKRISELENKVNKLYDILVQSELENKVDELYKIVGQIVEQRETTNEYSVQDLERIADEILEEFPQTFYLKGSAIPGVFKVTPGIMPIRVFFPPQGYYCIELKNNIQVYVTPDKFVDDFKETMFYKNNKESEFGDTPDICYYHQITNKMEREAYEILKEFPYSFYIFDPDYEQKDEYGQEILKAQNGWRWVYEWRHEFATHYHDDFEKHTVWLNNGLQVFFYNDRHLQEFLNTSYYKLHDKTPRYTFSQIVKDIIAGCAVKIDGWHDTCGLNNKGQLVYFPSNVPVTLSKEMLSSTNWEIIK
jgi:hypothetical protein